MADRRLQVFHAVAKHLSFTKAAEALFMTQPAVTFQIRQLEEHFNTRLFERGRERRDGEQKRESETPEAIEPERFHGATAPRTDRSAGRGCAGSGGGSTSTARGSRG